MLDSVFEGWVLADRDAARGNKNFCAPFHNSLSQGTSNCTNVICEMTIVASLFKLKVWRTLKNYTRL